MKNLSQYLVKNPKQVLTHLKALMANKCLISASFGEGQSFLTAILAIDEKKQTITIDCGPKEYLNKELLSCGIVDCKTDFEGIKVLFKGHHITKSGDADQFTLQMKIPETLYWVQRRKSYRVRSPLSKNSFCTITIQDTENQTEETHDLKLYDISVTGFSILCETQELAEQMLIISEFDHCKLVLEDNKTHQISFIVQSKVPLNANKPKKTQRIGCKFINATPGTESAFLRYMQMIEREIKRTLG